MIVSKLDEEPRSFRRAHWQLMLGDREAAAIGKRWYVPSTCFALIHLGLGERERALDWLEKGLEQRELSVPLIYMHPAYDDLRAEPRFTAIIQRLGLGPALAKRSSMHP